MITSKTLNIYSLISLSIMVVLLVLLWTGRVDESLYLPLFLVATLLFAGRVILRIVVARQQRGQRQADGAGGGR